MTRYLTRRPKNIASIELRQLALTLTQLDKADFIECLDHWYLTHEDYLSERSISEDTGRTWYTHKRLSSAYRSLRTNSNWLFSELKRQLHSHHGLNEQRKLRFIKDFLLLKSLK